MESMSEVKQAKNTFSQLGWCYIAGTVAVYLLEWVVSKLIELYKPEWASNNDVMMILSTVIVYGCAMPLIALLVSRMKVQKPERRKMKWWQFLIGFIICYALVYVSNIAGIITTTIIGLLKGSAVDNGVATVVSSGNMLINFVSMVVLAPIVEELVFRKLIIDRTAQYGQTVAIITSGLMFGLFHGNLNQFVYALVLGCFFAFIYLRTGNIKITIAMHAILNFMGSMVAGGLMKLVRYSELMLLGPEDEELMLTMITEDIVGWILLMLYVMFLLVVVITGIVFFFLSLKKMKPISAETDLPKGQRMNALFVNPGMIVFCVIWIILIVLQLFGL